MSGRRPWFTWWVLLLCVLCVPLHADDGREAAKAAVHKLAADVAAGKKISEEDAKAFAGKHEDLEDVMNVFKAPKRGQPSLETILCQLAKKTSFTTAQKAELRKIANLSRALAIVTPHYLDRNRPGIRKRDWDDDCRRMGEWSVDLLEGLKADQGKMIARAATRLAVTCSECHFRGRPPPLVPLPPFRDGIPVELIGQATEYWFTRNWSGASSRANRHRRTPSSWARPTPA
jgi:hypothetical protein